MANIWSEFLRSTPNTATDANKKKKKKIEQQPEQKAEIIVPKKQPVVPVSSPSQNASQKKQETANVIDRGLLQKIGNAQLNSAVWGAFNASKPFSVSKKPDISALIDPKTGAPKNYADMKTIDVYKMVYQFPREARDKLKTAFVDTYMNDAGSPFHYPYYAKGSNKTADVALWGTNDLDKVRKDPNNHSLLSVLERNPSGESFKAPTKKSSLLYKKAYSYQYLMQDGAEEDAVRAEVPALNAEVAQLAIDYPDASPDEIIGMVDWDKADENGEKLFKNIKSWRDETQYGGAKNTVSGGLYIGNPSLEAVVEYARNGGQVSNDPNVDYLDVVSYSNAFKYYRDDIDKAFPLLRKNLEYQAKQDEANHPNTLKNVSENFDSMFGADAMDRYKRLAGKAIQSVAGLIRSGDIFNERQTDPLEQSIGTTGNIDLRDPSVSRDLWPYLLQSGFASQDQANAILESEKAAAQAGVQQNPDSATGSFVPQTAAPKNVKLDYDQLMRAKTVLTDQLSKLATQEDAENELPEIDHEIERLENDRQYADDPAAYNGRLNSLYQQKAAIQGSANDKAKRDSEKLRLQDELNAVNSGINDIRNRLSSGQGAPDNPANSSQEETQDSPKETETQYVERLTSAHIDDMQEKYDLLNSIGVDARSTYEELTNEIAGYDAIIGDIPPETIESAAQEHPEWLEAYGLKVSATLARDKVVQQMKAQGIDITDADRFDAAIARQKQEIKDAAVIQYSTLGKTMTDFPIYSQKGATLKNADMDDAAIWNLAGAGALPAGVKNPATFAKDHAEMISTTLGSAASRDMDTTQLSMLFDMSFMTDDETDTYSYLLANPTFGRQKANLYYEGLKPYLYAREGKDFADEYLKGHPWLSIGYRTAQGFAQGTTGIAQLFSLSPIETSRGEFADAAVREGLAGYGPKLPDWMGGASLAQAASDLGSTTGYAVPSMLAEAVAPGIGGALAIGASAGGNYYRNAVNNEGRGKGEAGMRAALEGVSQAFMGKLLGTGVQGGRVLADVLGKKLENVMAGAVADFTGKLIGSGLSNASEEYLQDIVTPILDSAAYKEKFKGINWTDPQAIYDGVMGALQAGLMDAPGILKGIGATKALGKGFTSQTESDALIRAGLSAAPGSQARVNAENAQDNIAETQKLPKAYVAGKLAESIMNNPAARLAYDRIFNPVSEPSGQQELSAPEIPESQNPEETEPETEGNRPPETIPEAPVEDYTLSPEEMGVADANAVQIAYAATQDRKSYPPELERLTVRTESLKELMNNALQAQLESRQKASDLEAENGEIMVGMANNTISDDSALKRITDNAKAIARYETDAETYRNQRIALIAEWTEALAEHANAVGKFFRDTLEAESARQIDAAKKAGIERRNAQKAADLKAQDEKMAAERIPKIDTRISEIDEQDAALSTNEAGAKQEALSAIEAENKAYADNAAAEEKERAAQHARSASDNYAAIQRQRQKLAKEKDQLTKERADISNRVGQASAPVKADQLEGKPAPAAPAAPAPESAPETAPAPEKPANPVQAPAAPVGKTTIDRVNELSSKELPSQAIPIEDIKIDPKTYQFKGGVNENGVTKPIPGTFRPTFANDVLVHKRLDGSYYIADGHHRLDLAKRSGEQTLNAIVLDEADGVTVADVRALAAARNLADGRGTALDAAKLFRESGINAEDLPKIGLSRNEDVVDKGIALASLSDEYFKRVVSGDIDEYFGVLMGKNFPNDEQKQMAFMKQVGPIRNKLTHPVLEEYANVMREAKVKEDDKGQFSFLPEYTSNTLDFARIVAAVKSRLTRNKALFKKLSSESKKKAIEAVGGNILDSEANLTEAQRAALAEHYMGNYMTGDLYKVINEHATAVNDGDESAEAAAGAVYDWVVKKAESGKVTIGGINSDTTEKLPEKDGGSGREAPEGTGEKPVKPPEGTNAMAQSVSGTLRPGQQVGQFTPRRTRGDSKRVRRASDIAHELYNKFSIKFTDKHRRDVLQRQAIALYERTPQVVVTRTFQNVDAFAHELGHHIFEKAGVFNRQGVPSAEYEQDLRGMVANLPAGFHIAYPANVLPMEASAEFVRNFLMDRNAAVNFSSEDFVHRFETQIVTNPELRALQKARTEFRTLLDAENSEIIRARQATRRDSVSHSGGFSRLLQAWADQYLPLLNFDIAANKKGYQNAKGHEDRRAYVYFSNVSKSATTAGNIIENGLTNPSGNTVGTSFSDVLKPIAYSKREDFNTYCLLKHEPDRRAAGKPIFPDLTDKQIADETARLDSENPEFEKTRQDIVDWWNSFIDEWVVNPNALENAADRIDLFRKKYPNYVPTFRSMEDREDVMRDELGDMGGLLGQARVRFQEAKGSDLPVYSPIENFALRIGEIVTATNKVLAMRKLHEIYQETTGMGSWIRDVTDNHHENKDEDLTILDASGGVHYYQVLDRQLYHALLVNSQREDGKIMRAVGALTSAFKHVTTISNPKFSATNAPRDFIMAYVKGSNHDPVTFTAQWIKALVKLTADALPGKLHRDSQTIELYRGKGGGDTSIAPRDKLGVVQLERAVYSNYFRDSLRQIANGDSFKERSRGAENSLRFVGAKLNDLINTFNNIVESAPRLAEFERTYKRTGNADQAIYASSNVTTDFWRSGQSDIVHEAGRVFAFMNAGIQETYSWYKMAKEARFDRAGFVATGIKAAVMFALVPILQHVIAGMMGGDDKKEYDLLADNIKEENIVLPKFFSPNRGAGSDRFVKVPKPKGPIPALGDAVGRALVDAMQKSGSWDAFVSYDLGDYAMNSVTDLFDAVNPFGSPVFAPAVQIAMNRTWYGSPIESTYMVTENIAKSNRVNENTSSAAILLANLPGLYNSVSPMQVDYFLNQTLGVVGDYLTGEVGNSVLGRFTGRESNYKVGSDTMTFIKKALTTDATAASDMTSAMYDMNSYLNGIVSDASETSENAKPYARLNKNLTDQEKRAGVNAAKSLVKKGGALYVAKSRTSQYYKDIDKIEKGTGTPDEKEIAIRKIKLKMLVENAEAVRIAEDYIRKYIKGTPTQYNKIYGKK